MALNTTLKLVNRPIELMRQPTSCANIGRSFWMLGMFIEKNARKIAQIHQRDRRDIVSDMDVLINDVEKELDPSCIVDGTKSDVIDRLQPLAAAIQDGDRKGIEGRAGDLAADVEIVFDITGGGRVACVEASNIDELETLLNVETTIRDTEALGLAGAGVSVQEALKMCILFQR